MFISPFRHLLTQHISFIQLDKVFWVDLDSVVMANFVDRFRIDRPSFNGSVFYSVPDNLGCSRRDLRASACTGFFVIRPHQDTYKTLVNKMSHWKQTNTFDQDMLNDHFRRRLGTLDLLPETYSSIPMNCKCGRYLPEDVLIAHFTYLMINTLGRNTGTCEDIYRTKKKSLSY